MTYRNYLLLALLTGCAAGEPGAPALVLHPNGVDVVRPPRCEPAITDDWQVSARWWLRGGLRVEDVEGRPEPGSFARGDELICVVQQVRGGRISEARSEAVRVGDAPPQVLSVSVRPSRLAFRDVARCESEVIDADGDEVRAVSRWTVDGGPAGEGDELVGPFSPGAEVRCEVVAQAEGVDSAPVSADAEVVAVDAGDNILLVLLDDIGIELVGRYGVAVDPPRTPTFDQLANEGLLFANAYSQPVCSPTRASILTGQMAHQSGIGSQVKIRRTDWELQPSATTLAEALHEVGYATAMVGKWHLSGGDGLAGRDALKVGGFDRFVGFDSNLLGLGTDGLPVSYGNWEVNDNGRYERVDAYNTTFLADETLRQVRDLPEPWFVWLSTAAAHGPLHVPPARLHSYDPSALLGARDLLRAMVESVDTELGRVLTDMDPSVRARTHVIVVADNGTAFDAGGPFPGDRTKGTVYEGGVRVPMVVSGPAVRHPGRVEEGLVHVTDLYATVLDLAGVPVDEQAERDEVSVSLLPALADLPGGSRRSYVASERFEPLGVNIPYAYRDQMVRTERYKLVSYQDGTEQLYDLEGRVVDGPDLLRRELSEGERTALTDLRVLRDRVFSLP